MATRAANTVRQVFVTLQFAVLIGLMIAAGVVWRQREFATSEALRFDTDQMLIIRSVCRPALIDSLEATARRAYRWVLERRVSGRSLRCQLG